MRGAVIEVNAVNQDFDDRPRPADPPQGSGRPGADPPSSSRAHVDWREADPWTAGRAPRRTRRFGVFMSLMLALILALSTASAYLLLRLDVRITDTGTGYRFSRGAESAPPFWPSPPQDAAPSAPAAPESTPQIGRGGGDAKVLIVDVPRQGDPPAEDLSLPRTLSVSEIYRRVAPSVVGVVSESGDGTYLSTGSGIVLREDGYIITNDHMVEGAAVITVVLETGEELPATLLGRDAQTDLAVLKVNAHGLAAAEFGNSSNVCPGDLAVAIGNPMGLSLQNTVTAGVISAINRDLTVGNHQMMLLQIDASVNPGNSGGPLINEYGQVIGIISSKLMSSFTLPYTLEGLGFAIPVSIAAPILNELIANGYVKGRPTIGIRSALEIDEQSARYFDYPLGIMVRDIHPDCDAAKQGLAVNDIITEVDGKPVATIAEVNAIKAGIGVGGRMTVTVFRDGASHEISFVLSDEGELGR